MHINTTIKFEITAICVALLIAGVAYARDSWTGAYAGVFAAVLVAVLLVDSIEKRNEQIAKAMAMHPAGRAR